MFLRSVPRPPTELEILLRDYLLDVRRGFGHMGDSYPLATEGRVELLPLLFYLVPIHRFMLFDVEARPYRSEDAFTMHRRILALDREIALRHSAVARRDRATIGLLLRKGSTCTVEVRTFVRGEQLGRCSCTEGGEWLPAEKSHIEPLLADLLRLLQQPFGAQAG